MPADNRPITRVTDAEGRRFIVRNEDLERFLAAHPGTQADGAAAEDATAEITSAEPNGDEVVEETTTGRRSPRATTGAGRTRSRTPRAAASEEAETDEQEGE